jgi:hypothetical protein
VWIAQDRHVRPVAVEPGLTDGLGTEVIGADVHEGDAVVVGENARGEAGDDASPFAPRLFGGGRR